MPVQQQPDAGNGNNEGQDQNQGQAQAGQGAAEAPGNNVTARTTKLVILKEHTNALEIKQKVGKTKACSILESALFISESKKDMFDHDYARPISSKDKNKQKSKKGPKPTGQQQQRRQLR